MTEDPEHIQRRGDLLLPKVRRATAFRVDFAPVEETGEEHSVTFDIRNVPWEEDLGKIFKGEGEELGNIPFGEICSPQHEGSLYFYLLAQGRKNDAEMLLEFYDKNKKRYNLHAGLSIPNIKEKVPGEVKAGQLIAIEPFATDGPGKVDGHKKSNIYRLHREDTPLKGPSKDLVKGAQKEFRTLPFSERWASRRIKRPTPILQQLVRQRAVQSYPILNDVKGGTVTQAEHTVLITEEGCDVLTRV